MRPIFLSLALTMLCAAPALAQWAPPTPEELKMTAQPEVPGASAVYLYREEATDDQNHFHSFYFRIKVLSEQGKEYGTVELPYDAGGHAHIEVTDIEGRTIHADGTVIPFTGKPFNKLVEKTGDSKVMAKVFSLPDIEVGSVLEYRYRIRYEDNYFIAPQWYIQSNLFTRRARYEWRPTSRQLVSDDKRATISNTLAWFPILPPGDQVKVSTLPAIGSDPPRNIMNLDIVNVPPNPREDYLPPLSSVSYRVLFYYTPYRTQEQFWLEEGKHWSKDLDKFIGPGPAVRSAAGELTTPTDAPADKLKKLYAAVMKLENSDFTRQHSVAEEHASGAREIRTTDDILLRKRGSGDQLTELFVALARAAGLKAYVAAIARRDTHFFLKGYLSFSQLDDLVAIVNVDGKDLTLDPGQRYMPFGHIAWQHTFASGVRQAEKGPDFVNMPGESFQSTKVARIAILNLSKTGEAEGTVRLTYTGVGSLQWRHAALTGDPTSLDHELTSACEHLLGNGVEVKLTSIDKLTDYEEPLTVNFTVKGHFASLAGRRLLLPSDLFEAQARPTFASRERKAGVFFQYPHGVQDVIRLNFPAELTIESMPKPIRSMFQKSALYELKVEKTATSYTIRRDLFLGEIDYPLKDYPALHTFYADFETQDREPVVLKPSVAAANPNGN